VEAGAEDAQTRSVVLDPVAVAVAEVLVVDEHLRPRMAFHPGEELVDEVRVVAAFDRPLGDRERLAGEAAVEPGQRLPFRVAGVEVGAGPVDPARAGVEVFRPVLGGRRRTGGQRAPDDRHRGLGQGADVDGQRRQAGFGEAGVDDARLAAAVDDDVDAAEGLFVGSRAVLGPARGPGAVVGGVDVEAAVGLAQRPHVGAHPLFVEELVEADQIAVAGSGGDPRGGDQLVAVVVVGGGEVDHRPRPGDLPAGDHLVEVGSPGAEGLDHRRVLVEVVGEVPEVGRVTGVGDAPVDLLAGREEWAEGACGRSAEHQQQSAGKGNRDCGTGLQRAGHRAVHGGK